MQQIISLPLPFTAEMEKINKKTREAKDASIYQELTLFYDGINSENIWKVLLLGFIRQRVQYDKMGVENLYNGIDNYIKEIQYRLPIVPLGRDPDYEITNMFQSVFTYLSFSTRMVIQKAINELVCEKELPPQAVEVIFKWNGYGLQSILLPQTLEYFIHEKSVPKLIRWMALSEIVSKSGNFQFSIDVEKLKSWCNEIGLSQLTFVSRMRKLKDSEMRFMELLPSIKNADVTNEFPADLYSLGNYIEEIIITHGMNTYFQTVPSGAGIVHQQFKFCCTKIKKVIKEKVEEIFLHHILEKDGKSFMCSKYGHRELSKDEVKWLDEIRK